MPTVFEIAQTIPLGRDTPGATIADGLKPVRNLALRSGMRVLNPEELAALEVPTLERTAGGFSGFQRPRITSQARKIAEAAANGIPLPVIEVAILPDGSSLLVDGQHRALGAIKAGCSLHAVIRSMSLQEAQALFSNQGKARRINPSLTVLAADDRFSEYVQDAVTCDNHVWSSLVGQTASEGRISPKQMFSAIVAYSSDRLGATTTFDDDAFDAAFCDELGHLVRALGTKKTNPTAFRPLALRALTDAAVLIIRRRGSLAKDIDRWGRHMTAFSFSDYMHLRRNTELTDALVAHWNKRLGPESRVAR